jgi:soluble lytic murein transglycosylase-like protein
MHCQPDAEMNALNGLPLSPSMSVMPVSPPSDFLAQHDKEIADPEPLKQYIADKFQVDDENADKVVKTAYKVSGDTGVAPNLLLAIAAVESSFDPHAEGRGSKGLMQIQVSAHREEIRQIGGIRGLYDIVKNFTLGGKIFKNCIAQVNGNVHKALLCYNGATVANSYPDKVLKIKAKFDAVEKSGNIED